MQKIAFLILFFWGFAFADSPFLLSNLHHKATMGGYSSIYIEDGRSKTFEELRRESFDTPKSLNFGSTSSAVWTKTIVRNDTESKKTIVLTNHLASIDEIDVWIQKEGNEIANKTLGDYRVQAKRDIRFRASSFSVVLEPNEDATVFIRHYSPNGSMVVEWEMMEIADFYTFILTDTLFWGLFIGSSLALFVYNASFFVAIRERFYLFYAAIVAMLLLYQLTISGVLHSIDFPFFVSGYGYVYGLLTAMLMLLFAHSFFGLHSKNKRLSTAIYVVCTALGAAIIASFVMSSMGKNPMPLVKIVALVSLLFSMFVSLYVLKKRLIGSALFFLGQSSLALAHIWQILSRISGFSVTQQEQVYAVAACSFFDMLFLSVAISMRIKAIKKEKLDAQKLLAIQTRYALIGQTAANIAHQWRQPVARVGTLAAAFETLLRGTPVQISDRLSPLLSNLKKEIEFMGQTMLQMEKGYKDGAVSEDFAVLDSINSVLGRVETKTKITEVCIQTSCDTGIALHTDKNSFENVFMILVDNALDALSNADIENKTVAIEAKEVDGTLEITVSDNGGGVRKSILKMIFDPFFTTKKDGKGIGLPIAKMLTEKNLNGKLDVRNSRGGLRCTVSIKKERQP